MDETTLWLTKELRRSAVVPRRNIIILLVHAMNVPLDCVVLLEMFAEVNVEFVLIDKFLWNKLVRWLKSKVTPRGGILLLQFAFVEPLVHFRKDTPNVRFFTLNMVSANDNHDIAFWQNSPPKSLSVRELTAKCQHEIG
ncbi:hypothetical protein HG530_006505 [Fusarium avenaceum]|nr:hypothetical protein HG530_006505 [Fusarium avenaceum]